MAFEPVNRDKYQREVGDVSRTPDSYGATGVSVANDTPAERAAFLNKVYLTLSGGVALSMATGFYVATQHPQLLGMFMGNGIMGFVILIALFVGMTFAV